MSTIVRADTQTRQFPTTQREHPRRVSRSCTGRPPRRQNSPGWSTALGCSARRSQRSTSCAICPLISSPSAAAISPGQGSNRSAKRVKPDSSNTSSRISATPQRSCPRFRQHRDELLRSPRALHRARRAPAGNPGESARAHPREGAEPGEAPHRRRCKKTCCRAPARASRCRLLAGHTGATRIEALAEAHGMTVITDSPTHRLTNHRSPINSRDGVITGVDYTDAPCTSRTHVVDVVVSAADHHHTETALLPPALQSFPHE